MDEAALTAAALALPEATEGRHMGNLDFRVRKKVFATLDRDKGLVGLNLTPEQQGLLITSPAFFPANGAWGDRGWTKAVLAEADTADLNAALYMSWINTAPRTLARTIEKE